MERLLALYNLADSHGSTFLDTGLDKALFNQGGVAAEQRRQELLEYTVIKITELITSLDTMEIAYAD